MFRFLIFISTIVVVVQSKVWDPTDYCNIKTCQGLPHTFWVYPSTEPAPACDKVIRAGLTAAEKKRILDLHNGLRQKVARGEESRGNPGPQPPAQYMRILEWDVELADLAQRWANQCNFAVDQCRDVKRFPVGQQIYQWTISGGPITIDVADMVHSWYDYVDQVDGHSITNFDFPFGHYQGLYTQMVWADTNKLGCGAIRYPIPSGNRITLICNYGPTGNIRGQPPYKPARA